jgi:hypothetical protein
MMRTLGLFMVAGTLVGCGGSAVSACEKATDATKVCLDAYAEFLGGTGGTAPPADETITCDSLYGELKGDAEKAAIELLECQEAAASAADCGSAEGFTDYGTAYAACAAPAA